MAIATLAAETLRVSDGTDYKLRSQFLDTIGFNATRMIDKATGAGDRLWIKRALDAASRFDNCPPDLICSTSPPLSTATIACELASRWNCKWIADFRDPPWENPLGKEQLSKWLNSCMRATLNTPSATKYVSQNWPEFSKKLLTVTNGVPDDVLKYTQPSTKIDALVYAGGVYPSLLRTIHGIPVDQKVHIYGFIQHKRKSQLRQLSRLKNVTLKEPVSTNNYLQTLRRYSSVLVEHPSTYHYRIPLKTYYAVASGLPIVLSGETSATEKILKGLAGVYKGFAANNISLLSECQWNEIRDWNSNLHWEERIKWLQEFTWNNLLRKMFENCV